ncbi:conserved hypothetical protein [Ricinus communis]|uniref:Uncharacterized protein n=1 Tax=Ricinus communis TaxID=3988 RepID=B9TJV4_RICCO|nr:conserved hypothetical protein [Ricinus communis]
MTGPAVTTSRAVSMCDGQSEGAARRPAAITRAPAVAACSATARPMPDKPPITTTN